VFFGGTPDKIEFLNFSIGHSILHVGYLGAMFSIEQLTTKHTQRFRKIRLASLKDSPEAFKSTYYDMMLLPDEIWEQQLDNLTTFVAVDKLKDIGIVRCALDWNESNAAQLYSLWVNVEHRGFGVASALINAVLEWARVRGVERVILNVVENNQRALSFYHKNGFNLTGKFEPIKDGLTELQMASWL
jgi:ribosomal protein S18 acetylase RimI-like enzyme